MLGRVFRYQGWLWRALNTLTDILALSVLWLLCSIPVLTLGAATTALYDSVVRCIRYKQSGPYERFFRTFKNELVPGLLLTLLWGAIAALGLWMLALLRQYSAEAPTAMAAGAAYYVALILPLGAACWVFPILSRCAMSFGALNKTALKFAAGHLPSTVVLVLMTAEIARLSVRWMFPLAFMPAVLMLLWSLFTEPAFKKHGAGIAAETESGTNTEDDCGRFRKGIKKTAAHSFGSNEPLSYIFVTISVQKAALLHGSYPPAIHSAFCAERCHYYAQYRDKEKGLAVCFSQTTSPLHIC